MKLLMYMLFVVLLCSSCGSSRNQGQIYPCPWTEKGAPKELLIAADDLLAFQSVTGRVPLELAEIDKMNLNSTRSYTDHSYAYHPTGIGVLSEGWRILIVDDRIRKKNYVWCVLRPPSRSARISGLRVAMIPINEAFHAGRMAGRGAENEAIKLAE